MIYFWIYLAFGLSLTAFVLWRASVADKAPLVEKGEWRHVFVGVVLMTLTWPFWLFEMLEAGW